MLLNKLSENISGEPAFYSFWIEDVNPVSGITKRRKIYAPNEPMRQVHARLRRYVRGLNVSLPYATAVLPGSSSFKNVKRHAHNRFFYLLDLKDAYPSLRWHKLAEGLCHFDERLRRQEVAVGLWLKRYCLTPEGGLAVGGPASPDLFNVVISRLLDGPLSKLCRKWGIEYSRYLDDLTFSSLEPIGERKRRQFLKVVSEAGFGISFAKARYYDLVKGPIHINGIGLELGGRMFVPRHYLRRVEGLLHLALRGDAVSESRVHGMMGAFWSATPRHQALNASERRVVAAYQDFLQQQKANRQLRAA
jgi:RNA-directed DNA polymerase